MPIITCESEDEFREALIHGAVLYFPCPKYLDILDPHYFVIITLGHPHYYLCCSTSRIETVENLIARFKYTHETFVWADPRDTTNPFVVDSYLNCNEFFHFTFQELWDIHEEGIMVVHSKLSDETYHQMVNGYKSSITIDEDFQDLLPSID